MFFEEVVGGLDHKTDDFVGRIDDSEAVCTFGIIDFVEVFIDDFEEFLFFVVVGNRGGGGVEGLVVVSDVAELVLADFSGEYGVDEAFEFASDDVVFEETGIVENGRKEVFGEDVLNEHFADVGGADVGVDFGAAEFEEAVAGLDVFGVGFALFVE